MAYSSILGADVAPAQPSGRSSDLLGPSDSTDSGSDALGTQEIHADSDASGTGERGAVFGADAVAGADIAPDRIVRLGEEVGDDDEELGEAVDDGPGSGNGFPEADPDGQEFTDLDSDTDTGADPDAGDGQADR